MTKKEKRERSDDESHKTRRFKPGTVAVRKVRKFEKGTDSILRWAPIRRLMKGFTQDIAVKFNLQVRHKNADDLKWRISDGSVDLVRDALEHMAVCIFQAATKLLALRHKKTLTEQDIEYVVRNGAYGQTQALSELPLEIQYTDLENAISDSGVQKLGYRGGIVRMSHDAYLPMKRILRALVYRITENAMVAAAQDNMQTLQKKHILFAMKLIGMEAIGGSGGVRWHHARSRPASKRQKKPEQQPMGIEA